MEEIRHPTAIELNVSVKPDISIQVDLGSGNLALWQISMKWKVAVQWTAYVPNNGGYWNYINRYGISELEDGLSYWNGTQWQLFELEVQEEYSSYIAEKEILK